ncbi:MULTISPECIES: hypothetical protein [unclassified Rhodococcus (in: high G+C Gram-positive bacteria)]|uniref:hypothetical protein n=1 Tax=Rhodococcus sp. SJ-3 TaxID=3454628 RepID=UPI002D8D7C10|nr:hypothetical protein [Rhodococcus sp. (in: high G+C Gram-positive bacteria)]
MSFPLPPTPGPSAHAARPAPQDVVTAYQLWCGVLLLTVITLLFGAFDLWSGRTELVDMMVEMTADTGTEELSRSDLDAAIPMVVVLTVVFGLVIVGMLYLVVRQMYKGKNWARMALTLIGVFMTLSTLPTVFGVGVGAGGSGLALGIISIASAVLTVGAIVLMHRRESNAYFLRLPEN